MSKKSPASGFWTYAAECVRILYWIYFKPFTFYRLRHHIHPELMNRNNNPFAKRVEFSTNPHLRRYAGQIWWLNAIMPLLAVFLVMPAYTLVANEPFDLFSSSLFLLGHLVGLLLARRNPTKLRIWWCICCWLLLFARTILVILDQFETVVKVFDTIALPLDQCWLLILGVLLGVGIGTVENSPWGLTVAGLYSVALGIVGGLPWNVMGSVALGLAWSMGWGTWINVVNGLALGMVYSLQQGAIAKSVVIGVICFAAYLLGLLRVYFWLPELLWMLILFLLFRQGNTARRLCYLPPRFDELIILPLPFMGQMIVEAYRENPSAARETITYLITSTNKQKVAAQAMAGIAVDSLSRCQLLGDIADITDELAWIPLPPPKELGFVLPQLLDISQGVRRSIAATSLYRQSELLNPPITALRELINRLAFGKNARLATTFGSIAQHWLTILETAQRTLEEQARYSKEIRQVYIAGNALDPQTAKNRFKGRIDLFREIETLALADQPPVLLLYGGRRTGKTSTLKYLSHRVGANLVPLLVDVQGAASATTLSGMAENLATQIIEAARGLPRRLDLPYPDKNKLAQDPFPALQDWLGQIERIVPSKRFLLCLDEFERLSEVVEATRSRTPLNFLRNVLQHRASWTLLFSGSHEPKELPDYWSDYLINTRTLRVSYLDEESARELIVQPVEDFTNIYDRTAIDTIIHLTRCQPYLVQLTCYEVVELLNRDIRENRRDASTPKATAQDVETVIPTVLERGGEYFRELWKSLTESDRNLLRRLVQGETPTPQDKAVLQKLERKEILEKLQSSYRILVPLVQKYIEQAIEEEE